MIASAIAVASMHAMGQQRAMGVFAGNVYSPETAVVVGQAKMNSSFRLGRRRHRWPLRKNSSASGNSSSFSFQNGLPWILVFDGLVDAKGNANPDDGTVVVVGDYSSVFDRNLSCSSATSTA